MTLRQYVAERAQGCCEYCGWPDWLTPGSFAVEHIQPVVRGGTDDRTNLAYACPGCNNAKYDATDALDPATGQRVPLFNPRQDLWNAHFQWAADQFQQIGLTPTGRATVARLRLNRPEVIAMRQVVRRYPTPETLDAPSEIE